MPAWPDTLPPFPLVDGFSETIPDTVLRTNMDQGPAKVRLRTTAAVRPLKLSYLLNKTQISTLETFYLATVQGGALAFDFVHPRRLATVSCRFVRPPEYLALNGNVFKVNLELEVLP